MRAVLALAVLPALLVTPVARDRALAENDRYTVLGFVKDTRGRPRRDITVELVRDKTGLRYKAETDESGLYIVVARLGDEALGESLTLRVGEARTGLTVRFDAGDDGEARGTRMDLEGARWVERSAWFRSTLARILAPKTH